MNNDKKRKASGRVPVAALLSRQRSIVLLDPKGELTAVMRGKAKANGGIAVIDPFVVLPPKQAETCSKQFRLIVTSALNEFQRKDGKHPWNRTE